jgi:UDP-N-acetylmuramoyl-L-alanyl-D-glutamate--2,6-diaminopimelate ligase
MKLAQLLSRVSTKQVTGSTDVEVGFITYDSRRVKAGALFVALRGENVDGHDFIPQAIDFGAVAVVSEEPLHNPRVTAVTVADSRLALADLAEAFFGSPSLRMKVAGVTGTNGKTTTTFLIKHICEKARLRCGLIGTVRYEIGDRILPAVRTTPEALDVQDLLSQMRDAGCKAAAMEVSSHALAQDRVRGLEFDAAVFSNLTQDHLDYHGTMENYFDAKAKLFLHLPAQKKQDAKAIINIDDNHGAQLLERVAAKKIPIITFGQSARADFRASGFKTEFSGTSYQLEARGKSYLVRTPLIGQFNVYNSLAALAAATALGIDLRTAVHALADAPHVPGRLEAVPAKRQFKVFVDYAHTDDALANVMRTLRDLSPNRLIVVFGCGGNRDRAKRPLMGAAVERHADLAIITSDNPRKENPADIIEGIKKGFRGRNYEVIEDRKEAIFHAISMALPRDIVLIAGKGHENYQEFADRTVSFDDVAVARAALEFKTVDMNN